MIGALLQVIVGSLWFPVALSALAFSWAGYRGFPYGIVLLAAVYFTGYELWVTRSSFRYAFGLRDPLAPWWHRPTQIAAIVAIMFSAFLGAGSAVYFLVRAISN